MVRVAGFIIRSNEWVILPKTDRANIPAVFAWWNVIGEISTTRTLIFFQDMITSANWNWDFIYSKGFNNYYILLSNISQALENTKAIPHNSKCRYGERGAVDAKPKAQIILDAAKVSAASGGNSEPKQGQRSQSARGFCPRSTMRVPQPDIIEHFGNADAVPQPPERCLSRKAGIVRCCPKFIAC